MRWLALVTGMVVLGCGGSARSSPAGVKVARDTCVNGSSALGFVGTYVGNAHATLVNPFEAGVSNEEPAARVDITYLYCSYLQVSADFGSACEGDSPALIAALQTPTSFVLVSNPAPFCLRTTKDRPGSAAFFIASGSLSGEALALEVSGGVWFNGDAGYADQEPGPIRTRSPGSAAVGDRPLRQVSYRGSGEIIGATSWGTRIRR